MKIFKKLFLISILLVLLLISVSAFASENTNSIDALNSLDIGNFSDESKVVTRGEFVSAISDILSYNNRPVPRDGVFKDVTKDNSYSGAVYDVFSRGYISGYAGGIFGCDDPVLYEQAVKIVVSALGYDIQAKAQGGYPAGYLFIANKNDLLDGVTPQDNGTLLAGDAARLIENAMNCPILHQTSYGDDDSYYEAIEGITLLSFYAELAKIEDIVYDNGISSLVGESNISLGSVKIGNNTYKAEGLYAENLLGYKVCAYVSCGNKNDMKVIYIRPSDEIKTLQISAKRLDYTNSAFSAENILYYDVYDKSSRAKVDSVADFIYNGKATPDLTTNNLKLDFGKLILIDNNSDNIYDVVHVEASEIFPVSYINYEDEIIYKSDGTPLELKMGSKLVLRKDGSVADLSSVNPLDIVTAKISIDGKVIILDVSSRRISAVAEGISSSSKTVMLNGKMYAFLNDGLFNSVKPGNTYEFCLDIDGYIAYIVGGAVVGQTVGVLVDVAPSQGLESRNQALIYTSKGKFETYFINEKACLDGSKKADQIAYIESNMKDRLVAYKLNSVGEISEIELPFVSEPSVHQTEDSFRQDYWADYSTESEVLYHGNQARNFSGKFVISDKTCIFVLPEDRNNHDNYAVTDYTYFEHSLKYPVYAYSIGVEDGYSDYVIVNLKTADASTYRYIDYPALVEKITTKTDLEGNVTECMQGYNRYGEITLYSKSPGYFTSLGIKKGDIIRYKTDLKNRVLSAEKIVDGTRQIQLAASSNTAYESNPRTILYNVYFRYGQILGLTTENLSGNFDEDTVKSSILKQKITTSRIYEVNTKNDNEIKPSTYNSIRDYKNTGSDYSKVFVHSQSSTDIFYVIYN